ncbi:MAG: hypothetical protein IV086_08660 [Hyphomonadaceae bacterium]|nr:MAG: hypothetical protein FD160_387 [Caulobacteraceae bacterium]MBT9445755.1 hypothetical protein [Hyphomonadaceae bacterium]TPW07253.1 MAG: hypothetical protein FD124_1274 [Alphaproteobacteria bacterium]
MRNPLRTMALAIALVSMPACAAMEIPKFENPLSVARTADQKAYALLASYAAVLEEATDLVRDPLVPTPVKQALVRAERVATPAAETLRIALVGYLHARADYEAIAKDRPTHERAAAMLAIAAVRLDEAFAAARAPLGEFAAIAQRK